jgi:hypothetical protein
MPKLTRWFIKTALVYLILALVIGLVLASAGVFSLPFSVGGLTSIYFHLFMVGWISQLIFGVANWMFPILNRDAPRGSETLGWATYFLVNAGLLLRAISEPLLASGGAGVWGILLALSSALLVLAGLAFVANNWNRVRGR